MVQVVVHNGDVEQALKSLKKKIQREGIFKYYKLKQHFETTVERSQRKLSETIRRRQKVNKYKNNDDD